MTSSVDETLYAFRRNVFVAASAGTGKTHRLTTLYALLSLGLTSMGEESDVALAPPILPSRIVATTFSRAAATEIHERVERLLLGVARGEPSPSVQQVIAARRRMAADPPNDELLERRARDALEVLPRARVDTVHGIAHAICRAHGLEMGIVTGARIEDEDEGRDIAGGAIDRAVSAALEAGGSAAEAARGLLRTSGGLESLRDTCRALFNKMDEDGLDVGDLRSANHLADATSQLAEVRRIARACAAGSSSREVANLARALLGALGDREGPDAFTAQAVEALETLFSARKISAPRATAADNDLDAFKRSVRGSNMAERATALAKLITTAPLLVAREREVLAVFAAARAAIAEERTRRGVLSFGDLLRLARAGLATDRAIQIEAQSEIEALFVDELQDTSLVQRDIVFLLRETEEGARNRRSSAPPAASGLVPHGLFLVGDRKQSIYAFRGADVSVFSRVAVELCGAPAIRGLDLGNAEGAPSGPADFLSLTESRRSGRRIVSFVNEFARADFVHKAGGSPRDFEIALGSAEALVPLPEAVDGEVVFVRDRERDGHSDPFREARHAALAAAHALTRGFSLRDVAILARRRGTIPLLENALEELGLPFVVAGRALFETREVRDVAALLRLIADPRDRHAIATVVRGPVVGLSDAALLELADVAGLPDNLLARDGPRLLRRDLGEEAARLRGFRTRFLSSRGALARMAPGEAVRQLIRIFDVDRVIAALPRARARIGNLDRLSEIASKRGGSLFAFSRWLDRQIADDTDEAEAVVFSNEDDAIRLTTIHGSKGLDFEAVVLVDLNAGPATRFPSVAYRKTADERLGELVIRHRGTFGTRIPTRALEEATSETRARDSAERKRLSYVAVTRAKRYLALVEPTEDARPDTLYATVLALRERHELADVTDITAAELAMVARTPPEAELPVEPANRGPSARLVRRVVLAATPLAVFRGCERRFELRFQLGLEEPVATGQLDLFDASPPLRDERREGEGESDGKSPRELGRASHRLLETWPLDRWGQPTRPSDVETTLREDGVDAAEADRLGQHLARVLSSAWARDVARAKRVLRETDLGCEVPGTVTLGLRGTADLFVQRDDGVIEVVDYKLRRPSANLTPYTFQLQCYALAVARRFPLAVVRAGILFLEGATEPAFLTGDGPAGTFLPEQHEAVMASLALLAERFAQTRVTGTYAGIAVDSCRSLRCGFVTACHRTS